VLTIQDTTELDFSTHRHTRGLGPISDASALGLKVHLTLCSSDAGVPLGILQETVWAREKTRRDAGYRDRQTVIEEKESYRWLEHQPRTNNSFPNRSRSSRSPIAKGISMTCLRNRATPARSF